MAPTQTQSSLPFPPNKRSTNPIRFEPTFIISLSLHSAHSCPSLLSPMSRPEISISLSLEDRLHLAVLVVPAFRSRFLAYGSRATSAGKGDPSPPSAEPTPSPTAKLLDAAAAIQVPHNYFTQFYMTSVAGSIFWAWKLHIWNAHGQLQIVWALMMLQGVRRLLESHTYTSSSKSPMWFAHWLLGLLFYSAMSIAIWVEGPDRSPNSWATITLVPAILTAHVLQHSYHAYLYRLRTENKGYQLPSHPFFPDLLCPHYTCEIAIYVFMSFLAAPEGRLVSWTLMTGMIFVVTNLGVTANATKEWYVRKFGQDKVGHRRKMIPLIW
ncbi:hypothetical protein GQ44DRAFT_731474 [Phaeosphaeriaceae sp. PMI808]|nr:hypothetical protein GQ44DRAFT_731474 [Phaeosphaeriaceae sp. PMI808]